MIKHICYWCYSSILHILTIWVTWRVSYGRQELFVLRGHLGSPPVYGGVRGAHLFSFLCWVCLRPVSCVSSIVSVSGLSIIDCPSVFSNAYLPVSLDCPLLIAPSVFSNVYLPVLLDCSFLIALRFSLTLICKCLWIVHSWLPFAFL